MFYRSFQTLFKLDPGFIVQMMNRTADVGIGIADIAWAWVRKDRV